MVQVFSGLFFLAISFSLIIVLLVISVPANLDTLTSFHPLALFFSCISAFLIAFYWLYKGIQNAIRVLSFHDKSASKSIRELVFPTGKPAPRSFLVALGGGSGLGTLLKGLKEHPINLTAIVTDTDDGGSSGRLRKDLQILPPGDIRNCLVALSSSESLMSKLFQYRFAEAGDVSGHSFGNLFIAAMTGVLGDFGNAVRESSSILSIKGNVVPVTGENVQLKAAFSDGTEVIGETAITSEGKRIIEIGLQPPSAKANPEALNAIDRADLVVLGPGSLFTSVIPNLLVPEISEKIEKCSAQIVYICNVMTQPGETDNFTAVDHVNAILEKTLLHRIDIVIVNNRRVARALMAKYEIQGQFWVAPTVTWIEDKGIRVITGDFLSETDFVRHNSAAIAEVILSLLNEPKKSKIR
ncbi:uridine diphosphate-N-acetylglucosamine-binding protein YvcK [bacterium]|nr:uridine diphosphate-N-acetylglucosamine-binding protein YvcK [bacterium]